jgi:putative copper export protein
MSIYQIAVFLHLLGAILWVGGIFFLAVVAVPVARGLDPPVRSRVVQGLGRQFRLVGWSALAVVLATGIVAAGIRGATVPGILDGSFWSTTFGRHLGEKLVVVVGMVLVSAFHDFVAGPAAARAQAAGTDVTRLRRRAVWLARVTAMLAILVVYLAVRLVRPG